MNLFKIRRKASCLKMFIVLFLVVLPLWLNGQEIQLPDSLVLKTLEGKRLDKQESIFDNESKESSRLYSVWNQLRHKWRPYIEYFYEYDNRGCIVAEEIFLMDSISEQWSGMSKNIFEFDKKGREITKISYSWNHAENSWTTSHKCETEFDKDGNKTEDISSFGKQNQWIAYEYTGYEYKYDKAGNCTTMRAFELDSRNLKNFLKPKYEYIYTYDDRGNLLSSSLYHPLDEYQWVPKNKFEYEYDLNGNRILETFYIGDEDYGSWDEYYKHGHEYDNSGRLTSVFFHYWDKESSNWKGEYNHIHQYDEMGKPVLIKLHIWNNTDWVLNEIGTYYYTQQQLNTSDYTLSGEDKVIVSFNRALGSVSISGAENTNLAIADMQGRIVYTKRNIKEQETIQATSWMPGTYVVSLMMADGQRISRKILVNPSL